jgi:hypothetical protein
VVIELQLASVFAVMDNFTVFINYGIRLSLIHGRKNYQVEVSV